MKKNVAKNIFVWSMIILLAFSSGIFLAQMYLDLQDTNSASAEVDNSIPNSYSLFCGDFITHCPNDNGYFAKYGSYFYYSSQYNRIVFNFGAVNKIFTNVDSNTCQYVLSSLSGLSSSPIFIDSWNGCGFGFDLNLSTFNVVNSANLIQTGSSYCYSSIYSGTSFTRYNLETSSNYYAPGGSYYLYSSCNSSFGRFVGYTSGLVKKGSNYIADFNSDFVNFSQFEDIIYDSFSNGTWYFLSLFDSSYNRLTLFVRVSSTTFTSNSCFTPKERFFYGDINNDVNGIYDNGYNSGYNVGYQVGHSQGVLDSNEYSFLGLLGAVVDAPIAAFTGLFNFELLGINLKDFLAGLFTICIIIVVVRLILVK